MKLIYSTFLMMVCALSLHAQSQIDLPITWDDTDNINYTTVPFGGNASSQATDPTSSSNLVLQVDKPLGAATWAGVTLSTTAGLASLIPFDTGSTVIKVKLESYFTEQNGRIMAHVNFARQQCNQTNMKSYFSYSPH